MALTGRKVRTRRRARSEFLVVVGVVGFVLLLQVVGSTVAGVSALRQADTATDEVFEFTAAATGERIMDFLQPAEDAAEAMQAMVRGLPAGGVSGEPRTVDTLDPAEVIALVDAAPQVGSVIVAFADGTMWAVHRDRDGAWDLYTRRSADTTELSVAAIGVDGSASESVRSRRGRDYTLAPWFGVGSEQRVPVWPGISPSELGDAPILHVLNGVPHDGRVHAVIRVELRANALSQYLARFPLGEDGEAFVLSQARGVIAAPDSYNEILGSLPMPDRAAGPPTPGQERQGPGPDGHQASELGIPDANLDALGTVYREGGYLVLETPLDADGTPGFTLYLRGTVEGVAPGIASFQRTMLAYSIVIAAVVVGGALLVILLRAPLARLRERAAHDPLTGLVNRTEFAALGDEILRAAERREGAVVVAMFDLDNFKVINDSFGHEAGDEALVMFARALEAASRPRDVVARLGGDEFAIVRWLDEGEDPHAAIDRIRTRALAAFNDGRFADVDLGASAGYAVSGAGLNDLGALVSEADAALVGGKSDTKGRTSAVRQ